MPLQPVILCGGHGLRLWPLSRKNLPKQFLRVFDNKSLFQITLERVSNIKNIKTPIIVTSKIYEPIIHSELEKIPIKVKLILEPESKNTTASIYLAAKISKNDDTLLILPSDHIIEDEEIFLECISVAIRNVRESWIVFGIKPLNASVNYGYIEISNDFKKIQKNKKRIFDVLNFFEKPNLQKAKIISKKENFFWNSGIFMCSRDVVLKSIQDTNKNLSQICDNVHDNLILEKDSSSLYYKKSLFEKIPSLSIDYAVLEKINNLQCIPSDFKWVDVGTFDTALNYIKNEDEKNIIEIEGKNQIYKDKNKLITTVGVKDLIVIDTNDATLITKKNNSENLKKAVEFIKDKQLGYINNGSISITPWGSYEIILENSYLKIKKLYISKNKRISYQYHEYRTEHWLVVKGTATIKLNGKIFELHVGDSVDIKKLDHHFIGNFTNEKLVIIEVQLGTYFGEDDIVRIDDPYFR